MKKILIYNWIPFDETENKGGGVTIYTRNLINALCESRQFEVYFLSSGRAYDRLDSTIRYERTNNIMKDRVRSYQIVNSPVLSSARLSFPYMKTIFEDDSLRLIIKALIDEIGGIDIFHFQNLEGLSLSVLDLKKDFPKTKFIYSLHNYYAICPQVMLWAHDKCCEKKETDANCAECVEKNVFREKVIFNQQIEYDKAHGRNIPMELILKQQELEAKYACKEHDDEFLFELKKIVANYTRLFVDAINKNMDVTLAVSKRVKEIYLRAGLKDTNLRLNYIGTQVAEMQKYRANRMVNSNRFVIAYLGYPRKNKGFYFLLGSLESMNAERISKVKWVIASPIDDENVYFRIKALEERGLEVIHYNGYKHDELEKIFSNVNLGIVPPIWEDNLPQVSIEMKAYGVPVLASNKGGASELSEAKDFVFEADNIEDFLNHLYAIIDGQVDINKYFELGLPLTTMDEHLTSLCDIYTQ